MAKATATQVEQAETAEGQEPQAPVSSPVDTAPQAPEAPAEGEQQPAAPAEGTPEAPAEGTPEPQGEGTEDKTEGDKPEAKKDKKEAAYLYSADTVLEYLEAATDEKLAEVIRKVGTAGFTAEQLKEALGLLKNSNVVKAHFGGNNERAKKLRTFMTDMLTRQVCSDNSSDLLNIGPVYIENSVGGNAALGLGIKTETDGVVKKTGVGIYFRNDHIGNSGLRPKADA